jgi:hypothetical protein
MHGQTLGAHRIRTSKYRTTIKKQQVQKVFQDDLHRYRLGFLVWDAWDSLNEVTIT